MHALTCSPLAPECDGFLVRELRSGLSCFYLRGSRAARPAPPHRNKTNNHYYMYYNGCLLCFAVMVRVEHRAPVPIPPGGPLKGLQLHLERFRLLEHKISLRVFMAFMALGAGELAFFLVFFMAFMAFAMVKG